MKYSRSSNFIGQERNPPMQRVARRFLLRRDKKEKKDPLTLMLRRTNVPEAPNSASCRIGVKRRQIFILHSALFIFHYLI